MDAVGGPHVNLLHTTVIAWDDSEGKHRVQYWHRPRRGILRLHV